MCIPLKINIYTFKLTIYIYTSTGQLQNGQIIWYLKQDMLQYGYVPIEAVLLEVRCFTNSGICMLAVIALYQL